MLPWISAYWSMNLGLGLSETAHAFGIIDPGKQNDRFDANGHLLECIGDFKVGSAHRISRAFGEMPVTVDLSPAARHGQHDPRTVGSVTIRAIWTSPMGSDTLPGYPDTRSFHGP